MTHPMRDEWVMTSWIATNRTAPPLEVKTSWVRAEWADAEIERLQQLLKPHFCLCQERKTDPAAHGEQCPYRTLCLREKTL